MLWFVPKKKGKRSKLRRWTSVEKNVVGLASPWPSGYILTFFFAEFLSINTPNNVLTIKTKFISSTKECVGLTKL